MPAPLLLQVVQEYERAVIFRLGRLLPGGAKGPGTNIQTIEFLNLDIDTFRKPIINLGNYSFTGWP